MVAHNAIAASNHAPHTAYSGIYEDFTSQINRNISLNIDQQAYCSFW
jgi:hypothetical protein